MSSSTACYLKELSKFEWKINYNLYHVML